jgi:hypothetical protein
LTNIPHTTNELDLAPARRLALKCESVAAAAKGWSVILAGRLGSPKIMTTSATDVAVSMVKEIAGEADRLHSTAMVLLATLRAQR